MYVWLYVCVCVCCCICAHKVKIPFILLLIQRFCEVKVQSAVCVGLCMSEREDDVVNVVHLSLCLQMLRL